MRSAALSDIGSARIYKEDALSCDPDRGIFIIADGIGGQKAGENAPAMAVEIVSAELTLAVDRGLQNSALADAVYDSFGEASREIYERARVTEESRGMACSLIAAVIQGGECLIAHAGDTRAYLCYNNLLHQITVDDTPVAVMVKRGYVLPERARSHTLKNILLKSIGNKPQVEANLTLLPVKPTDRLLLCSDGLWAMVSEAEMLNIIRDSANPENACKDLVACARANGGNDNITVIIVELDHPSESDPSREASEAMPQSVS